MGLPHDKPVDVYTTCPQSKDVPQHEYLARVADVARWSEAIGCRGILVYTDNGIVDPWLVSQIILQNTSALEPLVAVQPIYMHPYFVAKKIATLAFLHERRVALNMLAGGFKNDLVALNDNTPHDDRYRRTVEYTLIVRRLLEDAGPVTFEGQYYSVKNLRLAPSVCRELLPNVFVSGSSDAGMDAARAMGALAVRYPKPPGEEDVMPLDAPAGFGVRVGLVARPSNDEAWAVAEERFPEDRSGQLMRQLATKVSDSKWHGQLAARDDGGADRSPYWLGPFQNYKTNCPYLVGDYDVVAGLAADYIRNGYSTFILDIPPTLEELEHTRMVFARAVQKAEVARV
jgi:alkanesulfonate monooxygenase